MTSIQKIADCFTTDVTRDIPPVVYFHEQHSEKLLAEVREYIITGGYPKSHPDSLRNPEGIAEQYLRLINGITAELSKPGGPEIPAAWISGFYGSGKSSFAKLFGLALAGKTLPDGTTLAEAWLRRDTSPNNQQLRAAYTKLRALVDPIAVIFDIGAIARDNEHLHAAAVRQVQHQLGYCTTDHHVADFELKLERDKQWDTFRQTAMDVLGKPWEQVKHNAMAEEDFSLVVHRMFPERYPDPMAWYTSRGGTAAQTSFDSPEGAAKSIRDMLKYRAPQSTVFLIIDEVSQYVLSYPDRVDRLRAFVTALGSVLRGKAWLLALGQQKLEEKTEHHLLAWAKDRFPRNLQIHLSTTNIREVVHKRLLAKTPDATTLLRDEFDRVRTAIRLYGYYQFDFSADEFIETYPLLPGHVDLFLNLTTMLRAGSSNRAQADAHAIRGLLQLLGELFRTQHLADLPLGTLITLDRIYDIQHTALNSDVQNSMARILDHCKHDPMAIRVAKTIALLELLQSQDVRTSEELIARCLWNNYNAGSNLEEVTKALELLRSRALVIVSEKDGYRLQSAAGEEWDRERHDIPVSRDTLGEVFRDNLKQLITAVETPKLQGRPISWEAYYSDNRVLKDIRLLLGREDATLTVDIRQVDLPERSEPTWIKKSADPDYSHRVLWVCGATDQAEETVRDWVRCQEMVKRYGERAGGLHASKKRLLDQERSKLDGLRAAVVEQVAMAWTDGAMYFRGRKVTFGPRSTAFSTALTTVAHQVLPEVYPHFVAINVDPRDLMELLNTDNVTPSQLYLGSGLGILERDGSRFVATCTGLVVRRVLEKITEDKGIAGSSLIKLFASPPYGYATNLVKACVAGLLRGGKIRISPQGMEPITAVRDAGVNDVFSKDGVFRHASYYPAGNDDVGPQTRARIAKFFETALGQSIDREDGAIADATARCFPELAGQLRDVFRRLDRLPTLDGFTREDPPNFRKLQEVLERCVRSSRQTKPTVETVKRELDTLIDAVPLLTKYQAEITEAALAQLQKAATAAVVVAHQLEQAGVLASNVQSAASNIKQHLMRERPWLDVAALDPEIQEIWAAYRAERKLRLAWQEQLAEQARANVKSRDGFATLSAEKAHRVLRPIHDANDTTTEDTLAPSLVELKERFMVKLHQAEEEANERLDQVLMEDAERLVRKVDLRIKNREVKTEAEVEALVQEIRHTLLEQVKAGARVRLV